MENWMNRMSEYDKRMEVDKFILPSDIDRCEKCDEPCVQITGAEAEQPYRGFNSNIALLKCKVCHHEFEPI
ncbi:MAG: hypothetical protein GY928_19135 [Colwellia sp.]|nr:hypothetical protein [Colwellia sp.]